MPYITKKLHAFFLLSLSRFCVVLGKISVIFLAFCSCIHFAFSSLSQHMYQEATTHLANQQNTHHQGVLQRELQDQEGDLNYCIAQMKHEILSLKQHRKRFHDCLSCTQMVEHSCTVNERIKKAATTNPHELYSYKLSGPLSAIDQLFFKIRTTQSGLFCKTIVLTKEGDNQYCLNLVFKEYVVPKK